MTLVYTFVKKLCRTGNVEKMVNIYKESYKHNIRFHNIILYTDLESYPLFVDIFDKILIADSDGIIFTDDFKYSVLSKLSNDELLFDGDIFLIHPLILNKNSDVICDRSVNNILQDIEYTYYSNTIDILLKNKINNTIEFFSNDLKNVPNIGILQFKNKSIEENFLNYYWKCRNWYIENKIEKYFNLIKNDYRICAVFGQYLLGLFIRYNNLKTEFLIEKNLYSHLSGIEKFKVNFKKSII